MIIGVQVAPIVREHVVALHPQAVDHLRHWMQGVEKLNWVVNERALADALEGVCSCVRKGAWLPEWVVQLMYVSVEERLVQAQVTWV